MMFHGTTIRAYLIFSGLKYLLLNMFGLCSEIPIWSFAGAGAAGRAARALVAASSTRSRRVERMFMKQTHAPKVAVPMRQPRWVASVHHAPSSPSDPAPRVRVYVRPRQPPGRAGAARPAQRPLRHQRGRRSAAGHGPDPDGPERSAAGAAGEVRARGQARAEH